MKVSFDGLRRALAAAYRKILRGYVVSNMEEIGEGLAELRSMIAGSMCIYSDDPEDMMTDMTKEVDRLLPKVKEVFDGD